MNTAKSSPSVKEKIDSLGVAAAMKIKTITGFGFDTNKKTKKSVKKSTKKSEKQNKTKVRILEIPKMMSGGGMFVFAPPVKNKKKGKNTNKNSVVKKKNLKIALGKGLYIKPYNKNSKI